jgi:DNA modification methylase
MESPSALAIEWVPIGRVHLNPANPRLNDEAVPHVAASIRRFGWQQPIVARLSGEVVAGNTRLKAAMSLGMAEVPVVWFEGSDLEATAYSIADNRVATFSHWNEPALAELLEQLRVEDALDGVGYTPADIDELLAQVQAMIGPGEVLDPEPDQPQLEAVSRPGDLWILGRHRLLCGDSSDPEVVDRLLAGAPVHLVNQDPPYNVRVEPRSNNAIAAGLSSFGSSHHQKLDLARHPEKAKPTGKMRAKDRPLTNDYIAPEEFDRLLRAWFGNAARVLLPGRSFYIWGGYANLGNYPPALAESELYFSQAIIWVKEHPVLTRKDFMGNFELAFYGWKEGAAHQFFGPPNVGDVWSVKKLNHTAMEHLTQKPVELAVRAIQYSSKPGENVLDLFGGSGSTLVACEQTGRNGFAVEIDGPYADVIVKRWQRLTGKEAVLEETGQSFAVLAGERGVEP